MVSINIWLELRQLYNTLGVKNPNTKIKEEYRAYYRSRLTDLIRQVPLGTPFEVLMALDNVVTNLDKKSQTVSYGELRSMISHILSLGPQTDITALVASDSHENDVDRRIRELEAELEELRSNPALEKKVAQIEEQVRKIRVASVAITEDSEKEQENMLKKYKTAKKKVFVIMPFAPVFDDVWHGGIKRACDSEDIGYLRVDKISLSSWITEDIKNYLGMADFVIADTTGNNPNVMFEFGWALALKKTPIVIRQKDDPNTLPFDVKDIRHISYQNNWSGIENLYSEICKFLRVTSETSENIEKKKKS